MMFVAVLIACAVCIVMLVVRAASGPSAFDRILAVNSVGTIIILGISLHGFALGRPEFVDISILYAVLNFLGTLAILRFYRSSDTSDEDVV